MQDQNIIEKLEDLSSACLWDKRQLKTAKAFIQNIRLTDIDSITPFLWDFFNAAVRKDSDEDEELAREGYDFARFLIEEMGLSIRARQPQSSDGTVLHLAACAGNIPVTKFLIEEKKANLNATNDDEDKKTPLDLAKKELNDLTTDKKTREDLEKVIEYLEQKQKELSHKLIIASDSPLHVEQQQRTTPPPGTPSPTSHSPTNAGSPENERTEQLKKK